MLSRGAVTASELSRAITALLAGFGDGPLFVHADLFRAGLAVPPGTSRQYLLNQHVELLSSVSLGRALWMPAFNYDFPRTGRFDVREDRSQVGPLTEHFRTRTATWRTAVPVFSVSGIGQPSADDAARELDPFGERSVFADLARRDGVLLFYGAGFDRITFLHHAERSTAAAPLYRYDKLFSGTVAIDQDRSRVVDLLYHVRPRGRPFNYDWDRLLVEATAASVCRVWHDGLARSTTVSVRGLLAYWRERLALDPLYLLDAPTRAWVEPKLQQLGRRFELRDFEPIS